LALDVSGQASLSENLGWTIESLLMQRPLIATRVGGMVDSVHHEATGLLVPPLDPDGLANAICRFLDDRAWAASLGVAGRQLMLSRFTLEHTVSALDAIYRTRPKHQASQTRGYRPAKRLLRRCAAIGVFGYLGGRLMWELGLSSRIASALGALRRRVRLT
jgi:hypothetical protein